MQTRRTFIKEAVIGSAGLAVSPSFAVDDNGWLVPKRKRGFIMSVK